VGQIEDKFKEISAQIKTFVNMKIRDLAQGSQGKLLKWILILLTLVFIGNHIYVNFIAILPEQDLLLSLPRVLEARKARILQYCLRNMSGTPPPPPHYLHMIEHQSQLSVAFCIPKKVGSLSLNKFFEDHIPREDYTIVWTHPDLPLPYSKLDVVDIQATTRVMIIRHPLQRLVSAFHYLFTVAAHSDPISIEQQSTSWLATKIISQLRPNSVDVQLHFSEFVGYILNKDNQFSTLHKQEREKWGWELAHHWQPISSFCSPCSFLPELTLELDTLATEFPFFLQTSGLSRVYGSFPALGKENSSPRNSKHVTVPLLEQLTEDDLDGILKYYKEDFNIGGYTYTKK